MDVLTFIKPSVMQKFRVHQQYPPMFKNYFKIAIRSLARKKTYSLINAAGERIWCKFHFKTNQGIENLNNEQAAKLIAEDRESHQRDLYESIEQGEYPSWTLYIQVMTDEPRELLSDLHNYGSLFLGHHAPVVFGDKAVGTNHTLPTLEVAKYSGGINVTTYLKVLTHQELTAEGADGIAPWAAKICELEGTHAHQLSAEARIVSEASRELARDLELTSGGGVDRPASYTVRGTLPDMFGTSGVRGTVGDEVTVESLAAANLAKKGERIKLVSGEQIDRKLNVKVHKVTASVRRAVEAAGGSIEELDG